MDNNPSNQSQPMAPTQPYAGPQYVPPAYTPPQPAAMQPMPQIPMAQQQPMPQTAPQPFQQPPMSQPPTFAGGPRQTAVPTYGAPPIQPSTAPVYGQEMVSPANAHVPTPPAPRGNANSTQNTLQIAEIRDGIVIMNDGSFRSVLMVKSINFDLMSQAEQESVEYAYQGFLNSLYFPIQIFVRSQKVDLQPYIDKLDKIRTEHDNMLLALLMEDYIDYIDELARRTNIMDKKFYVVIPFFPDENTKKPAANSSKNFITGLAALFGNQEQHVVINEEELEKAKTELRNRVQACLSGLLQCGVQGLPLDTQELIELYYDTYNPDTATRQQLKDFNQLSADIVTKGQGMAPQTHLQRELA